MRPCREPFCTAPRDVRFEERADAEDRRADRRHHPRSSATCICGSDLWPYRGMQPIKEPTPMGHEYCGIVEEVGSAVTSVKPGQFVIGSFFASDNTCPHCQHGLPVVVRASRVHRRRAGAVPARAARRRHARRRRADVPSDDLIPSLLARLGRPRHRLVRGRRREREAGRDGRGRRRRRGRPARRALRQADGRRADHRHEPPRAAPEARARVRRDRHRRPSAATKASRASRS